MLHVKKVGNFHFGGDYRLLNLHTRKDVFSMLLVENVLTQLGKSQCFFALDL